MKYAKSYLRNRFLLKRRKKSFSLKKFNFDLLFSLIKKNFYNKKIIIAGYYPSDYEVDILNFLESASKKNFKIVLPVIKSSNLMTYRSWLFKEPLYINGYGIPEPEKSKQEFIPDLVMVPLVAYDSKLNRIGYGKGYYDRSLKKIRKVKKKAITLGIAYSFQKCKDIPVNKHDFKLDYIFTEQGIIRSN